MTPDRDVFALEEQIAQWRGYVLRRQAIHTVDVAELEDHLREQVESLVEAGLGTDEAFLVAVKRMGNLDALSREFAREHSERLWKQLVVLPPPADGAVSHARRDAVMAFALAAGAAVAIKLPALFGQTWGVAEGFYMRNFSLFVLPFLAIYFLWKRGVAPALTRWIAVAFAAAVVFANVYPFAALQNTLVLSAIHLPIALWLVVGVAYAGNRWTQVAGRMDFIRFTGELFIYCVLMALGGGVCAALTSVIFKSIGVDVSPVFEMWLVPCGIAAVVVIAAWLVEAKQSVIENMAPVLARLFTPLFALVLLVFLGTSLLTGRGVGIAREVLIVFDLLLVLVLALLLYSISARDTHAPPGMFDVLQLVLLVSALAADIFALSAILSRIDEFGFSPNRVAVLGINLILLVNLAWATRLSVRFLRGRTPFASVERWQTSYMPVYAAWAAIVVIVFPPLFHFA